MVNSGGLCLLVEKLFVEQSWLDCLLNTFSYCVYIPNLWNLKLGKLPPVSLTICIWRLNVIYSGYVLLKSEACRNLTWNSTRGLSILCTSSLLISWLQHSIHEGQSNSQDFEITLTRPLIMSLIHYLQLNDDTFHLNLSHLQLNSTNQILFIF